MQKRRCRVANILGTTPSYGQISRPTEGAPEVPSRPKEITGLGRGEEKKITRQETTKCRPFDFRSDERRPSRFLFVYCLKETLDLGKNRTYSQMFTKEPSY